MSHTTSEKLKYWIRLSLSILLLAFLFCDSGTSDLNNKLGSEPEWINGNSNPDTTVFYVSNDGNDNHSGITQDQAFKTISKAFHRVGQGGKIRILPGIYYETIGLSNSGDDRDSILISGLNGIPILDGEQKMALGIFCEACKGLIFENLTIQNFTDIGISASNCQNIVFRNLTIKENGHKIQLKDWEFEGYGIHVENSENIIIQNNDISRNGPDPQIMPDYLMGTGINTYGNINVIISHNRSYNNIGGGILVEDSEEVIVKDNEVFNNDCDASVDEWWDAGLWVDGGKNVTVQNNSFRNNLGAGIEISDEDDQSPTGYILQNNVSAQNYFGIYIWNFGTTDWPDPSIIQNTNNQFTDNTRQDVWIEE